MNSSTSSVCILIPNVFQAEIKYTIECLLGDFLGIDYSIIINNDIIDYKIVYETKSITIKNHFFTTDDIERLYTEDNIPTKVNKNDLVINGNQFPLVSLFGDATLFKENGNYSLDSDIIASTFFMLTRWEEHAIEERDKHNRFMASSSLAFKEGFLNRPIVNEYVEILWELLKSIGYSGDRKIRKFTKFPSHDVDKPFMWNGLESKLRSLAHSVIKMPNVAESVMKVSHMMRLKDPYDTHDLFMDYSEKINVKSAFYFMSGGVTKFDNSYAIDEPRVKRLIAKIKNRGHIIGFHPSYNAYNDYDQFRLEKEKLEEIVGESVQEGREHFLRFSVPNTFAIWEQSRMSLDSTLSYADCSGFRCGVCYSFSVFNILERKKYNLVERPLIVMEGSLKGYEKLNIKDALYKVTQLMDEVKKYDGEFTFLWHNSSFNDRYWIGYEKVLDLMYFY